MNIPNSKQSKCEADDLIGCKRTQLCVVAPFFLLDLWFLRLKCLKIRPNKTWGKKTIIFDPYPDGLFIFGLPVNQIPAEVRRVDPNLRNKPTHRLLNSENNNIMIDIGVDVMMFTYILKYEGWNVFRQFIETAYSNFGMTSITLQTSTSMNDDAEALYNFVSSIVKEMKPLDADIEEFISENFWELI